MLDPRILACFEPLYGVAAVNVECLVRSPVDAQDRHPRPRDGQQNRDDRQQEHQDWRHPSSGTGETARGEEAEAALFHAPNLRQRKIARVQTRVRYRQCVANDGNAREEARSGIEETT